MSLPALQPPCPSADSRARILKEASGVEPGWVEIMPRKRVTDQVRTWLLSAQTEGQRAAGQEGCCCPPSPAQEDQLSDSGVRIWGRLSSFSEFQMVKNPVGSASETVQSDLTLPCPLPPAAPVHLI